MCAKLLGVLFFFCVSAFAKYGNGVGGGGAVVCRGPEGKVLSTELLDYYEARTLPPQKKLSLEKGSTPSEKVQFVIERLRKIDPRRADRKSVV